VRGFQRFFMVNLLCRCVSAMTDQVEGFLYFAY